MGHVLLAPDKFKGSLTAAEVVHHLTAGLRRAAPDIEVRGFPVADGGDGTLDAAVTAGFRRIPVSVAGPTGAPVNTAFGYADGVAVVELADACGLRRLPAGVPEPLRASSRGAGEVIRAALEYGCAEVVLGLGGSASTDGGAGLVGALGVRLLDERDHELPPGGAALRHLRRIDLTGLHPAVRRTRFVVAGDVDNPLLGPTGAAAVYGPQKGATDDDVLLLEAGLTRWADLAEAAVRDVNPLGAAASVGVGPGQPVSAWPGAGAAGGVGFAALGFLGARFRPGIELLLDLLGFPAALVGAELVVTGEGSLDAQSLRGKAPVGVARAAVRAGVPTVAVAGQVSVDPDQLREAGIQAGYPLTDLEPDPAACLDRAAELVEKVAETLAADWLDPAGPPRRR
ncbi:glycerate kinase [Plantactinospora mayteni]|uniref:Glycerate kinase n=1 Tax=Plantactinospora mayteni TaxID=566021 RepID=A0ABQ4EGE8_9ACTN|nr:glycerate kinase [Plantactinospora mayteni]GIG93739.1 glycerate kinase [Plantactinospora mayteni]